MTVAPVHDTTLGCPNENSQPLIQYNIRGGAGRSRDPRHGGGGAGRYLATVIEVDVPSNVKAASAEAGAGVTASDAGTVTGEAVAWVDTEEAVAWADTGAGAEEAGAGAEELGVWTAGMETGPGVWTAGAETGPGVWTAGAEVGPGVWTADAEVGPGVWHPALRPALEMKLWEWCE